MPDNCTEKILPPKESFLLYIMSLLPFSTNFFFSTHMDILFMPYLKREKLPSAKNKVFFSLLCFLNYFHLSFLSFSDKHSKKERDRDLFLFCALLILISSQSITNWLSLKELLLRTPTS